MKACALRIGGAYLLDIEPTEDERGFFARTFCVDELAGLGMEMRVAQCNTSFNRRRGTLRGMHFQTSPMQESKIVRCVTGRIYDVIVDIRRDSRTRGRWEAVELDGTSRRSVYIPAGCAHGFQTLEDDSEVLYLMGQFHSPQHARGVRFDDPAFAIRWPIADAIVSPRDRSYPDYALE